MVKPETTPSCLRSVRLVADQPVLLQLALQGLRESVSAREEPHSPLHPPSQSRSRLLYRGRSHCLGLAFAVPRETEGRRKGDNVGT